MTRARALLAIVVCLLAAVTVAPLYMITSWLAMHFAQTLLLLLPSRSPAHRLLALWLGSRVRCWKCGGDCPSIDDLRRLC